MASRFDGATLLILGCVALVVICVLIVGWPSAGNSVRNLGMPNSTAPYAATPGSTAPEWGVPGSTAAGWAVPGSTVSGKIATHDAPT